MRSLLLFAVALGLAACWSRPAVTTPVADLSANVFVLELSLPRGVSAAEAEAAENRALQREAAELELKVSGSQDGTHEGQ
jgi:hypothetical protein